MSKLAIKGHATRGEEVIKILEMLGGKNEYRFNGKNVECRYCKINGVIHNTASVGFNNFKLFTLEEFLEKYPYKIGDKVIYTAGIGFIQKCTWDEIDNDVTYIVNVGDEKWLTDAKYLQLYKEETMEKTIKTITIEDFKANTKEWLIDTLESMSKDDALQTICDLHDELQKLPTKEEIKDSIARGAANIWCRCYKCDKIIRDTNAKCDKGKLITCHQWYDGYRTALLALGDERCKEMYK